MALHHFAEEGDTRGLQDLLSVDKSSMEGVDKDGNTALIIAAWCGNDEGVDALIKAGASLEATNKVLNDRTNTTVTMHTLCTQRKFS